MDGNDDRWYDHLEDYQLDVVSLEQPGQPADVVQLVLYQEWLRREHEDAYKALQALVTDPRNRTEIVRILIELDSTRDVRPLSQEEFDNIKNALGTAEHSVFILSHSDLRWVLELAPNHFGKPARFERLWTQLWEFEDDSNLYSRWASERGALGTPISPLCCGSFTGRQVLGTMSR